MCARFTSVTGRVGTRGAHTGSPGVRSSCRPADGSVDGGIEKLQPRGFRPRSPECARPLKRGAASSTLAGRTTLHQSGSCRRGVPPSPTIVEPSSGGSTFLQSPSILVERPEQPPAFRETLGGRDLKRLQVSLSREIVPPAARPRPGDDKRSCVRTFDPDTFLISYKQPRRKRHIPLSSSLDDRVGGWIPGWLCAQGWSHVTGSFRGCLVNIEQRPSRQFAIVAS